jgi:signal transduction histidine kinase
LHRRLFVWFGLTILATMMTVGTAAWIVAPRTNPWRHAFTRGQTFIGGQLAQVWNDPARRDALLRAAARDLDIDVVLEDAAGRPLATYGAPCKRPQFWAPVLQGDQLLGHLRVCAPGGPRHGVFMLLAVFGVAGCTLWIATGLIARRVVRPLGELVRVANAIGGGDLKTRATLKRNKVGEVGVLADAINDMADRIERQMADQRELLAAVSHEIRSPLARMRVLTELARERDAPTDVVDEIEREVVEVDSLVGQLLASSRLDFAALEPRPLDARDIAMRCIERAGLPPELLSCELEHTELSGDPTLLSRAVDNLLDNAKKHGGGASSLAIAHHLGKPAFVVEDAGAGFSDGDVERVFESFVRGERSAGSSLGLGLALVRRIARAHGGDAWAENRPEGGARVGFSVGSR